MGTTQATVEEALRQVAERSEAERAARQRGYLQALPSRVDVAVLSS